MNVVITGVSQGLGKELFDLLVVEDANIVALSRRFLEDQYVYEKNNSNVKLIQVDLANMQDLLEKLELVNIDKHDEYIFINNAGTILPISNIKNMLPEEIISSYNINTIAPAIILQKISNTRVFVLNISTGAASRPIDNWSLYCSSKAGAKMFFDVINISDCTNIEIINYDPGVLDTQMQKDIRDADFSAKEDFIALSKHGHLKSSKDVARDIFENILKKKIYK